MWLTWEAEDDQALVLVSCVEFLQSCILLGKTAAATNGTNVGRKIWSLYAVLALLQVKALGTHRDATLTINTTLPCSWLNSKFWPLASFEESW